METVAPEKKETPAGATGEGAPAGATVETNLSGENKEQVEAGQGSTPPVQVTPLVINEEKLKAEKKSKVVFAHMALMEANGLKQDKLPTPLKMKINAWAMGVRKYDKQPSPKLLEMNKKGSIAIADAIQDYIEKDLPDKSEEQMKAELEAKEVKAKQEQANREREEREAQERMRMKRQREESERKQREELERKERELKAKKDAQDKIVSAQKSKEEKVASILKEKGKIHYKDLVEILGHDIGESVEVGSIKLLNVCFTNSYKQVK
jgi:hypothetical protein